MDERTIIQTATGGEEGQWLYALDTEGRIYRGRWSQQQFTWKEELPLPFEETPFN